MRAVHRLGCIGAALVIAACQAGAPASSTSGSPIPSAQPSAQASAPPGTTAPPITPNATATAPVSELASPAPTWSPQPQPTLALPGSGAPAIPTGVQLTTTTEPCDVGSDCLVVRVSWASPSSSDVTVRVYGVTQCLHKPTASGESVLCLANGDVIPTAALYLLASAPSSAGAADFTLGEGEHCSLGWLPGSGQTVYAVIVQAANDLGGSIFAYAQVGYPCPPGAL